MQELTEEILTKVITARKSQTHKGSYGKVLIIGGNEQYGGAAIIAAESAVHSGAGLVTVACANVNHTALHAHLPEAMVVDYCTDLTEYITIADVIVIGCGLGLERPDLLKKVLSEQSETQFLVIDGSAITLFAENQFTLSFPERTIFTPHQMELQRLSGIEIAQQNVTNLQEFTKQLGATIVAKSHETKIFSPHSEVFVLKIGTPAQATGGMGDTLAGLVGAFLGQFHKSTRETVAAAIYLHSYIARELAQKNYVVLPTKLINQISKTMKQFEN